MRRSGGWALWKGAAVGNTPVLVLGISPRSGTNHLEQLLCLHRDCAAGRQPIREDFFLELADHLLAFGAGVRRRWDPAWGHVDEATMADLYRELGNGLLRFLTVDVQRRLVAKTPSVVNLTQVFTIFPAATVLLLVRDGRAVVESCVQTFGWDFDLATRRWAAGADTIGDLLRRRPSPDPQVQLVRYEELVSDPVRSISELLAFLDLDPAGYDFEAVARLPVRGSSVHRGTGRNEVHWEPVARDATFDPLRRWEGWNTARHERFAWLAGSQQQALGYDLVVPRPTAPAAVVRHRREDARWWAGRRLKLAEYGLRRRLGPVTRPLRRRLGLTRDP